MYRFIVSVLIFILITLILSCADSTGVHADRTNTNSTFSTPAYENPFVTLPSIDLLDRQTSAMDTDLVKSASKYQPTYNKNISAIDDDTIEFKPNWDGKSNTELAFSIYKFNLTGYTGQSKINFTWSTAPADYLNCWIGISYWQNKTWQWYQPKWSLVKSISLKSYEDNANATTGSMFVAVVMTGTLPASLKYVQVGTNLDPVAVLKADKTEGGYPLTVNFDASESSDTDGTIVYYRWDFEGDGTFDTETTNPKTTFKYEQKGVYQEPITSSVKLQVVDKYGATGESTVEVKHYKTFKLLVINFDPINPDKENKPMHELIRLDASWTPKNHVYGTGGYGGYISDLDTASHGWFKQEVVEWIDVDDFPYQENGFKYTHKGWWDCWNDRKNKNVNYPWNDSRMSYQRIIDDYKLVDRINSGEIDEVIVFCMPYCGAWETQMIGPTAYWCNSGPIVDAKFTRNFIVTNPNYEREIGCFLENFGHRTESIMEHVSVNWATNPYAHPATPPNPVTNWDKFGMYDGDFPGKAALGCIHYAPNTEKWNDYQWNRDYSVSSTCDDWLNNWPDLKGTTRTINRAEWGGDSAVWHEPMRNHHVWWFKHIPCKPGTNPDGKENNWWKYMTDYNNWPESTK